jgi:hypothetical protein
MNYFDIFAPLKLKINEELHKLETHLEEIIPFLNKKSG